MEQARRRWTGPVDGDLARAAIRLLAPPCPADLNFSSLSLADFDLFDVFGFGTSSGERDPIALRCLMNALEAGTATLSLAEIPAARECGSNEIDPPLRLFAGGSSEHVELHARAVRWFWSHGIRWTRARPPGYGGGFRADVIADDGSIVVECGYTSARKALAALSTGLRFLVVPYAHEVGLPWEVGFLFERSAEALR